MSKKTAVHRDILGEWTATVFFSDGVSRSCPGFPTKAKAQAWADAQECAPVDEDEGWQTDHEAGCGKQAVMLALSCLALGGLTSGPLWLPLLWG